MRRLPVIIGFPFTFLVVWVAPYVISYFSSRRRIPETGPAVLLKRLRSRPIYPYLNDFGFPANARSSVFKGGIRSSNGRGICSINHSMGIPLLLRDYVELLPDGRLNTFWATDHKWPGLDHRGGTGHVCT